MYLGVGDLGQQEKPSGIQALLAPILDPLGGAAAKAADPLVEKLKPAMRDAMAPHIPTFAIYSGLAMGGLVLLGIVTGLFTTKQRKKR